MKKGRILLSFALLCSPFWLTAAQNSDASQNSSAASSTSKISSSQSSRQDAASRSSTLLSSNLASNSAAPQSGSAENSTPQSSDGDNLGTINVTGKVDLSTTEGTGSYTTGNEHRDGAKFKHKRNAAVHKRHLQSAFKRSELAQRRRGSFKIRNRHFAK